MIAFAPANPVARKGLLSVWRRQKSRHQPWRAAPFCDRRGCIRQRKAASPARPASIIVQLQGSGTPVTGGVTTEGVNGVSDRVTVKSIVKGAVKVK